MMQTGVVLAAGKGTRMQSKKPKVLHQVLDKTMIEHVITSLQKANVQKIIVILGHEAEMVKAQLSHIKGLEFAYQEEQLGTGHAMKQVRPLLEGTPGNTIVVYGDTPLLTSETIQQVFSTHEKSGAACTVLTGIIDDATGYGRIIRDVNKEVLNIVEEKDASPEEKKIKEFNSGTYCFKNEDLFERLEKIQPNNAQKEYYLTDMVEILKHEGEKVEAVVVDDNDEITGINDRVALAEVTSVLQSKINRKWQIAGVTIVNPHTTYIGPDVIIGRDVVVEQNVQIYGKTVIKEDAIIKMNSKIRDSEIGHGTIIDSSHIVDCTVGNNSVIGPYSRFRANCIIGNNVRIGNFVEMKNVRFGDGAHAAHLTYLGDAEIGKNVNFGCGSVTVNYNGFTKETTVVEDDAFIGCNTNLIAPVTVGKAAITAAGSTITKDVPAGALAIERGQQVNKEEYADVVRAKYNPNVE